MARNLPAHRRRPIPQPRPVMAEQLVPYFNAATQQMTYLTQAQLIAKQREDARLVARWQQRRDTQRQRDRQLRRFWLGFGAVIALVFVILLAVVGWWIWTVVGLGVLAVPVVLFLGGVAAAGGHRCITIVQHMH
jgi:Flp pilus assembly protein TadB